MRKRVLFINPSVYDFKCYDEWMRPAGLYLLSNIFKKNSIEVSYINCMDRFHKNITDSRDKHFNTGDFHSEEVNKPKPYYDVPRKYKRYGITEDAFTEEIAQYNNLSAVFITCMMTYWYPGLFVAVKHVKKIFPKVPVIIGGIYPTLCYDHAKKHSGADFVIRGSLDKKNIKLLSRILDTKIDDNISLFDYDYLLENKLVCLPVITTLGCPFSCTYCASSYLYEKIEENTTNSLIETIKYFYMKHDIKDYAFYDDALLYNFNSRLKFVLDYMIKSPIDIRFHTPNAIHSRFITKKVAEYLFKSGFKTIRIGFETTSAELQRKTGNKTNKIELEIAIRNLKDAGFTSKEIGVYVMLGIVDQTLNDIYGCVEFIASLNVLIKPVFYSPVPHTKDYEYWKVRYPEIIYEPLYQNDTVFNLHRGFYTTEEYKEIRTFIHQQNVF